MEHAHHKLVVHRDLKPRNILVADGGEPKLLDFGVAGLLEAGSDLSDSPTPQKPVDQALGLTLLYSSPEQVSGEAVSVGSDVYSLGVVLYEMLTGRYPYRLRDRAPATVIEAILEQPPTRTSRVIDIEESDPSVSPEELSYQRDEKGSASFSDDCGEISTASC